MNLVDLVLLGKSCTALPLISPGTHFTHVPFSWRYDWSIDEAKKNLLRTHTTAVSSKMLYKLAQGPFEPKKYFSIDRVFRNETVDATHLAEFHQVEGLVADYNLTLGDLIGVIAEFFKRIGGCSRSISMMFSGSFNV